MLAKRVSNDHFQFTFERLVPDRAQRTKLAKEFGHNAHARVLILERLDALEPGVAASLTNAWSTGDARAVFPWDVPTLTDWTVDLPGSAKV